MAMVKLDKELNDKLVRYEILMDKWFNEYSLALKWAMLCVELPTIKSLAHAVTAMIRKKFYHVQLWWMVHNDWDVAQYNHHRVELMDA